MRYLASWAGLGLIFALSGCGDFPFGGGRSITESHSGSSTLDAGDVPVDEPDSGVVEEPDSGPVEEPDAGPAEEPDSGVVEEPDSGPVEEPDSGPVEEPDAGDEPDSGPIEEPDSGPVEEPDAGDEPDSGPVEEPDSGPVEEPDSGPVEEPDSGPVEEPDAGDEPDSGPVEEPDAGPVEEPDAGDADSGPVEEPDAGNEPDSGPVEDPDAGDEPDSGPVDEPDAGTETDAGTNPTPAKRVLFLHHSVGNNVWHDGQVQTRYRTLRPNDSIRELSYPARDCPEWSNRPTDYHYFWVDGGDDCTANFDFNTALSQYNVIIFKFCYTHDRMYAENSRSYDGSGFRLDAQGHRVGNRTNTQLASVYRQALNGLKTLMNNHPTTQFIVWTVAPHSEGSDPQYGTRANDFASWMKTTWDQPGDNVFIFDVRDYLAGADGYLKAQYFSNDEHPSATANRVIAQRLVNRIRNVVEGRGDQTPMSGQ